MTTKDNIITKIILEVATGEKVYYTYKNNNKNNGRQMIENRRPGDNKQHL